MCAGALRRILIHVRCVRFARPSLPAGGEAGRVGADSTSLESSLQAVADYDTEVRLFFTLPDGTLDRAEMDQAKGLADVLLAVPVTEMSCSTH